MDCHKIHQMFLSEEIKNTPFQHIVRKKQIWTTFEARVQFET